jgi:hypothetical protein
MGTFLRGRATESILLIVDGGLTLGTIRVVDGGNVAVNLAFGENELWIVGKGGVWYVNDIAEHLAREW